MLLLGIVRGHWDLPKETQEDFAEQEGKLNRGIAVLTPAQELRDLLESDKLKRMRETERRREREENGPTLDATIDSNEQVPDRPFTKADFEAALKKVARKIQPKNSS
jgi:hypothetical protein